MSNSNEGREEVNNPLWNLELALKQEVVTGKNKKEADFKEAYKIIEQHLASKVPQRVVLDKFNEAYGYTLHPPRFRKMLLDERKRHAEAGDVVCCITCGQQLPSTEKVAEEVNAMEGQ